MLLKIFGSKEYEITEGWRNIHNEEFYDLYSSPNIIRVNKSRKVIWAGHVARMGDRRCAYRVLVERPDEKNHFKP